MLLAQVQPMRRLARVYQLKGSLCPNLTILKGAARDRLWVESCQCSAGNRHSTNARQIYNSENRPGSGIADKVNALAVPVVVEVPPLDRS